MKLEILFKDKKTAEEFPKVDLRIKGILADTAFFLGTRGYPCLVTCLWRAPERQVEIRKKAEKLGQKEPVKSPHEFWRAADLSIKGIPHEIVSELISYLNEKYPYDEGSRYKTALRHDVGFGDHVHIQVPWQVPQGFRWVA